MKKKLIAIAVLGLLLFSLFASKGSHPTRLLEASWNWGHILLFALLTYYMLNYWPWLNKKNTALQITGIFAVSLLFGVAIEIFQFIVKSGTPDIADVVRDLLGSALIIVFLIKIEKSQAIALLMRLAVLALLMNELLPVAYAGWDEYQAEKQFPLLDDFECTLELSRWGGISERRLSEKYSAHGNKSMEVVLSTNKYSGVSLNYFPQDWSAYDSLCFSVYNPDSRPLKMICRIHDALHPGMGYRYKDRFHKELKLAQGWNHLRIALKEVRQAPESRETDMRQIRNFALFATRLPQRHTIYLDHIYLK